MKKLGLALLAIALGLSAGAETYDGKVLDGEWLINGGEDVVVNGTVSGAGDIRFQPNAGSLMLNCEKTAVGDVYVDWGVAYVANPLALGAGALYLTDETVSGIDKKVYFSESMTVTNDIHLGSENTANWGPRLVVLSGKTVNLSGLVSVYNTKILADGTGRLVLSGGVSGNKLVAIGNKASAVVEIRNKPLDLTGTLFVGGSGVNVAGFVVLLNVAGNAISGLYGFDGATLKLGVDNPFSSLVPFAPQDKKKFSIDLNGHSLDLGSCANEGAGYGSTSCCTILNSAASGAVPTVSVRQTNDNYGTEPEYGAAFAVSGRMNFTKRGSGKLKPNAFDIRGGELRVEEGTLRMRVAGTSECLAGTVVVAGGTLDLGGGTFFCYRLEQRGGAIVNGRLIVRDANVLYADTEVTAEILGKTVKPSGTDLSFQNVLGAAAPLPYAYELPEGTVFYLPFDTADTMGIDFGSCRACLYAAAGTPTFEADGKHGGCLYVDGASRLESGGVPAGFPVGASPVTVSCWIKPDEDCSVRGGWFSYGDTDKKRGSSYCFSGSHWQLKWYANDVDVYPNAASSLTGGWHHVVGVWDGTYRDFYIDGVLVKHDTNKPLDVGTSVFMIGKTMWDDAFKGCIDEVLVLNRAAGADEVSSLYANGVARSAGRFSEVTVEAGSLTGESGTLAVAYPFDSAETFLRDVSKSGATLSNSGAAFSTDSAFGTGGSAEFDGSSFLSLDAFPSAIPSGGAARTLLCFVKGDADVPKEGAFISYGNEGWDNARYLNFAFRESGAKVGLYPWGAENGNFSCNKDDFLGRWQAVAAVWDGAKVSFFTNGVYALGPTSYRKTTGGSTLILDTTAGGFKIGKAFYNGSSYFKGNLDEVAICNRALTQAEIADYAKSGIAALMPKPLAPTTSLELEEGASFSAPHVVQTIAGLGGSGAFSSESLTLTARLSGAPTIGCDLTLADGVVICAGDAPAVVSGRVTFAGGGSILLPDGLPKNGSLTLLTANSFAGFERLEDCIFENLPRNTVAELKIKDGNKLVLTWTKKGLLVVVR